MRRSPWPPSPIVPRCGCWKWSASSPPRVATPTRSTSAASGDSCARRTASTSMRPAPSSPATRSCAPSGKTSRASVLGELRVGAEDAGGALLARRLRVVLRRDHVEALVAAPPAARHLLRALARLAVRMTARVVGLHDLLRLGAPDLLHLHVEHVVGAEVPLLVAGEMTGAGRARALGAEAERSGGGESGDRRGYELGHDVSGVKGTVRSRRITALAAAALGLAVCAPASAAPRVVDLDGLRGGNVKIAGGVRLADAGAIVAATVDAHVALVRLRHDGSVVDSFGRGGVAITGSRHDTALAVTAGPGGRQVVVAVRGRGGSVRLVGVDGRGRPRPAFAPVTLPATAHVALAARGNRLAVAAGSRVATLSLRTGEPRAATTAACDTPRSASLTGTGRLLVACGSVLAVYYAAGAQPAGSVPAEGAPALGLAGAPDVCVAERGGAGARPRRADPATLLARDPFAGAPALPAHDRLAGLAPDPRGGCNLLLAKPSGGGRIVQADAGGRVAKLTALPGGFRPGAVFVCHSHVLTAGVRSSGRVAALAVIKRG